MLPFKEEKQNKKKKRRLHEADLAEYYYKYICRSSQIDRKKYNPFKLKYLNCLKKNKRIRAYFDEINRTVFNFKNQIGWWGRKSKKYQNFITNNFKKVPDESNPLLVDTKNILRKLKFESKNEPSNEFKPKTKFYKPVKKPKLPQSADIESSYYNSLIIT